MRPLAFVAGILLCSAVTAGAAEKDIASDLLSGSGFRPMRMNGEITGLKDWDLLDFNRVFCLRDARQTRLPDGRELFKLDCKDGVFTVEFREGCQNEYYKYRQSFHLYPNFSYLPPIPAGKYHFTGMIKLNRGKMLGFGKQNIKASPDWQKVDYTFPPSGLAVNLYPEPGLKCSMKDFRLTAEYPKIGGSIRLPDGGSLTSLIVPKKASYLVKRLVFAWRGWLWKLTGTALPVYERETVRPEKGTLVFMPGNIPNKGYDLTINKDGGTLVYGWPFAVNNALYNYLREFGYIEYDRNNRTALPTRNADLQLKAVDQKFRPKFGYHTESNSWSSHGYARGTVRMNDLFTGIANWYAMPVDTEYHFSSQLLPPPEQRKLHPECMMMSADGRRQTDLLQWKPGLVSPCLTDPPTRKYLLDRIVDVLKIFPDRLLINYALGDLPDAFCHCPRCRKVNEDKTGKGYASVFFDFLCAAAERAKKEHLSQEIAYCAYHTYSVPPVNKKIPENMVVDFCVSGIEKPCNIHIDCPLNAAGGWRHHLTGWSKLAGREHTGVLTYETHNPFLIMELLAELQKYGSRSLHLFTSSPVEQYVAARWNQGDDPAKIVQEYNDGVFGADAGKYVTAIQRLVYEYDKKYKHYTGEFTGWGTRMYYRESLDRKTFDKVYALFDRAEKAIRARKGDAAPLLWEKFQFMTADLRKYPRSGCVTDAELKAFAGKVAEFIRISGLLCRSKQYPYYSAGTQFTVWKLEPRFFLLKFCGLRVPKTRKIWTDEPVIVDFMKDPVKNMIGSPEKRPGHWRFQHIVMRGGDGHPNARVLRRESSGKGKIVCSLKLDDDLKGTALLSLSGWDDEKPGKTTFRLLVNGKEIFSGANTFPEDGDLKIPAGDMYFPVPAGLLKKGENLITLVNTVKDDPAKTVRRLKNPAKPEDGYAMSQDYLWGWVALKELRLTAPDDEFLKFADGKSGTAWTVQESFKPVAKVTNGGGKVTIRSSGAKYSAIIVPLANTCWLLPKGVKFKMRLKVTGSSMVSAGLLCYPADASGKRLKEKMQYSKLQFKLTGKEQILEGTVEQKVFGYCSPHISIEGNNRLEISEFSLTPLPMKH